jgi:hypothetical protein
VAGDRAFTLAVVEHHHEAVVDIWDWGFVPAGPCLQEFLRLLIPNANSVHHRGESLNTLPKLLAHYIPAIRTLVAMLIRTLHTLVKIATVKFLLFHKGHKFVSFILLAFNLRFSKFRRLVISFVFPLFHLKTFFVLQVFFLFFVKKLSGGGSSIANWNLFLMAIVGWCCRARNLGHFLFLAFSKRIIRFHFFKLEVLFLVLLVFNQFQSVVPILDYRCILTHKIFGNYLPLESVHLKKEQKLFVFTGRKNSQLALGDQYFLEAIPHLVVSLIWNLLMDKLPAVTILSMQSQQLLIGLAIPDGIFLFLLCRGQSIIFKVFVDLDSFPAITNRFFRVHCLNHFGPISLKAIFVGNN